MRDKQAAVARVVIDIERLTARVEALRRARALLEAASKAFKEAKAAEESAAKAVEVAENDLNDEFDGIASGEA